MRSIVLIALALAVVPGCSFLAPTRQDLTVWTADPDAEIWVDDVRVGKGRVTMPVRPDEEHRLYARAGALEGSARTHCQISSVGVLDIILGAYVLVPFFGALAPGFWELSPAQREVLLRDPAAPGPAIVRPNPRATSAAAVRTPPRDRRIRDESDYAWPNYAP